MLVVDGRNVKGGKATISGTRFENCVVDRASSLLTIADLETLTFVDNVATENTALRFLILTKLQTIRIAGCLFQSNKAQLLRAYELFKGSTVIDRCRFVDTESNRDDGACFYAKRRAVTKAGSRRMCATDDPRRSRGVDATRPAEIAALAFFGPAC